MFQLLYKYSSKKILAVFFFLFVLFKADAQSKFQKLESRLLKADSVILVSHLWSPNVEPVDAKEKKQIVHGLIQNEKINQESIVEKQMLNDSSTLQLSKILCRQLNDEAIEMAKCFMPHHAIIIYSNGKISFIDICFGCHRMDASKELHNRIWKDG